MNPSDLKDFDGLIGEMRFADGARVRAHILSVDPDVLENHVFYDVLEVVEPGHSPHLTPGKTGFACSATEIVSFTPTDGGRYLKAPGSSMGKRPWWKLW
jgi:hypothetical protein